MRPPNGWVHRGHVYPGLFGLWYWACRECNGQLRQGSHGWALTQPEAIAEAVRHCTLWSCLEDTRILPHPVQIERFRSLAKLAEFDPE